MATAIQGFRLAARSCSCKQAIHTSATRTIGFDRAFTTTSTRLKKGTAKKLDTKDVLAKLEESSDPVVQEIIALEKGIQKEPSERAREHAIMERIAPPRPQRMPSRTMRPKQTFMNIGDPDPWEYEDTLQDDDDDINALAHGELEQHREIRHYARLAAWELPMLSKLAKPFQPPTADMPLRFRYTTYMGDQHPAEKKVVLEFSPADMPNITDLQREKLKKLAGVRYNPGTDIVKMNCEMFETQAQNKRYLGDMVDSLLAEARDPTDMFEDVPLDTRHHHFKPKPKFPKEWKMTEQRRAELEQYRQQVAMKEQQRAIMGQVVDGVLQIEEGLKRKAAAAKEANLMPEMVMAGSDAKAKGRRLGVRR